MKYILVLIASAWTLFSVCIAAEDNTEVEIKGGFGYVLGEDGSKLKGTKINDDTIEVQAKSSFRSFNKCLIELNEDKLIYTISARASFDSEKDTDRELKIVLNLLEKKYKATFEDTTNRSGSRNHDQIFYTLQRDGKNICVIKQGKKALRINYWDSAMNNSQRDRKKRALEQQNNNNTDAL